MLLNKIFVKFNPVPTGFPLRQGADIDRTDFAFSYHERKIHNRYSPPAKSTGVLPLALMIYHISGIS